MAVTNTAKVPVVLTRGRPVKLGTVTASNDVIKFAVPMDSYPHRGQVVFQAIPNTGTPTTITADIQIALDGATYINLTGATALALAAAAARADLSGVGGGFSLQVKFSTISLGTSATLDIWAGLA